jgi:hypothetical protein
LSVSEGRAKNLISEARAVLRYVLGVDEMTVRRDTAANAAPAPENTNENNKGDEATAENAHLVLVSETTPRLREWRARRGLAKGAISQLGMLAALLAKPASF